MATITFIGLSILGTGLIGTYFYARSSEQIIQETTYERFTEIPRKEPQTSKRLHHPTKTRPLRIHRKSRNRSKSRKACTSI